MAAIGTSYNGFSLSGGGNVKREDGSGYRAQATGKQTWLESTDSNNPLKLETKQEKIYGAEGVYSTAAALRVGKGANQHLISFTAADNSLVIDGKVTELPGNTPITLSDGTTISRTAKNGISIKTSQGDVISMSIERTGAFKNAYLNIIGEVSPNRQNDEVRGALGGFDDNADWHDDVYLPSGNQLTGTDLSSDWLHGYVEKQWLLDAKEDDLFTLNAKV
ncbi:MAG: hypothetical protein HY692_00110 [Cyanobacteria bacterium NC_groundwater_1444_Ag_S-0.65um_54_12]|nr:hypothetical protein [Cyanobacteria bacterium NC_groundwater_1444_Ag_S-0.65um_54_12]